MSGDGQIVSVSGGAGGIEARYEDIESYLVWVMQRAHIDSHAKVSVFSECATCVRTHKYHCIHSDLTTTIAFLSTQQQRV